nr:DUF1983 domain-containing protein [Sodalis glossinidius]
MITETDHIVQGITVATLQTSWEKVDGAINYLAQWRRDKGDWVNVGETSAQGFSVQGIYAGGYDVRVRAVNAAEVSSPWGHAPSTTSDGQNPLLLANVPYPAVNYQHGPLPAGVSRWYRARLVDRIGNKGDWTPWVRGESSSDASEILGNITEGFLTAEDGARLTEEINTVTDAVAEAALANNADMQRWRRENGQRKAEILEVRTTVVDEERAFAEYQQRVQAEFKKNKAMIDTRATTVFDHTGSGSALFSVKVGVDIDGTYCDAGMTIAAIAEVGQPVITRIGFNANQFVILSGPGGKSYSPFSVINGQVFINEAFINYAGMTLAKVGSWYSANYVPGQSGTIMRNDGSFELNGRQQGGRMAINSDSISVYDGGGNLKVRLGKLN